MAAGAAIGHRCAETDKQTGNSQGQVHPARAVDEEFRMLKAHISPTQYQTKNKKATLRERCFLKGNKVRQQIADASEATIEKQKEARGESDQ